MGAGQSDLYKGTYGDIVDNIPMDIIYEKEIDFTKSKNNEYNPNIVLTDAQKSSIKTLENTIKDHLTEKDFSGTKLELQGKPVIGKKGIPFQHVYEMKTSYKTLIKVVKSLEGSLKNPNLGENEKILLQNSLDKAVTYIQRITKLLSEFGEL